MIDPLMRRWIAPALLCSLAALLAPRALADDAAGIEFFEKKVRPLLIERCYACHSSEAEEVHGGLLLDSRDGWMRGGDTGEVIVPGDPDASELIKAIRYDDDSYHMPPSGMLPEDEIAVLVQWVKLGAPDPRTGDVTRVEKQAIDFERARQYWAFQPLQRHDPPRVENGAWCETPINRFVLARLEAAGLAPTAPADKRRLIRRTYFNLIGMPPEPEEVQAFLNDNSPEAYEALIDRLLASPHYGERWGRYWLDLARFAESHGFEHDYDRPTAYHYRDFVIQAFNDDLPYHTFVKWQLAGDELAPDNHLAMMATGFLAAGVHSTQITANQAEKERYDELDDMLSTTGTAMLGLTIGCARCHDHKFDPIPQRDYYRLLSTFTTTVRSELELDTDPEGYRQAKAEFHRQHEPYVQAVKEFEANELPGRLAAWERDTWPALRDEPHWIRLDPAEATSQGGAEFVAQPDGSLLAVGNNADFDTYTFTVQTNLSGITAVRLEALADESMKANGPGRAGNGNFALTDFRLTAAPADNPDAAVEVPLQEPRATFEQQGLPIAAAIDDDAKSGWAVDPEFGKDHAAAFNLSEPVGGEGEIRLTFTLEFRGNKQHNLGRVRLSAAIETPPGDLAAEAIPEQVFLALGIPANQRSEAQQSSLLHWYRHRDAEWQRLDNERKQHEKTAPQRSLVKALVSSEGTEPVRLHTQGPDFYETTYFLTRGDPNRKEGPARQGFLQVLTNSPHGERTWQLTPPPEATTSLRRTALANWLTDVDEGAGALLARVMVNRLWQGHFGRGIVATPNDFGSQGAPPTHPELLDWLATELVAGGWRLKRMHKLILLSAVYQQDSAFSETKSAIDPDNGLLWRYPVRRLEAEAIRDSLLAVSGLLDRTMFGPGTLDESNRRRSIYFTIKRSELIPFMQLFDAPDALQGIATRPTTTIAPQALLLMNSPVVREYAHSLARRAAEGASGDIGAMIDRAWWLALNRSPTSEEAVYAYGFLAQQTASYEADGRDDAEQLAAADLCQTLLSLNEFIYVD